MSEERIGPYVILGELGKGGMGTVYHARHVETAEEVALKVLPPALARETHFVLRFKREITTLKQLDHPGIVHIREHGQDGDLYYYAMEYVEGRSLEDLIDEEGGVPDIHETMRIVRETADALGFAHSRGIIHRDIKPANILLDLAGKVKLTDFGIAKMVEATRMTATGAAMGTAEYMAPEQAEGKTVDARTDVYALGVVFYRMVSGRLPFTGATAVEMMKQHRFNIPEPPKNYNPELNANLSAMIEKMLAKNPKERYESMPELIRQLNRVEDQVRRAEQAAERPSAGRKPRERRAERATPSALETLPWGQIIGYGVLIALLVLLGLWWHGRRKRQLSIDETYDKAVYLMQKNADTEASRLLGELLVNPGINDEMRGAVIAKLNTLEQKRTQRERARADKHVQMEYERMRRSAERIVAAMCYHRGLAYLETGETDLARGVFQAVLVLFPDSSWAERARESVRMIEMGVHDPGAAAAAAGASQPTEAPTPSE